MPTTILQAPVGAGKTEIALNELISVVHDPQALFKKVWVLLATKRQETAFRQRLIERNPNQKTHFNIEFFNFYELNARLLNMAGKPPRRINQGARYGLLRAIINDLMARNEIEAFANIAHTSGFVRIVADFIYELKQNLIYPEDFLKASQTSKDRALAHIYAYYQTIVQQFDLVDREGEGWLALAVLKNNSYLARDVALLLVDGYDQFTPTQAQLLAQLSLRVGALKITLTDLTERSVQNFGGRFRQALNRISEAHRALGAPLDIITTDTIPVPRHPDLIHIEANLFRVNPPARSSTGGVHFIEAPDPAQEMAAVLRRVRRLLLDGVPPDEILIVLRDWGRYQRHAETYQRLYKLPLLMLYTQSLAENPLIATLMQLLELSGADFPRDRLLDCLRSPYIQADGLGPKEVAWLDQISRQFRVVGGRDQWQEAIEMAQTEFDDDDGVVIEPLLTVEQASKLSSDLETFFNFITPQPSDSIESYVAWLEMLIGEDSDNNLEDEADTLSYPRGLYSLHIAQQARQTNVPVAIVRRDISALNRLKGILRGFLATQELLRATIGALPRILWEDFYANLLTSIKDADESQPNPTRSGKVLVTGASDARGLPHQHVFVLGLAEGIFPSQPAEDPLYLDNERVELSRRGVFLQTLAERTDDAGLFYEIISLPRQSLTLSRPTIQDGTPWIASYLWRAVRELFVEETVPLIAYRVGRVLPYTEVATLSEALLAVVDSSQNNRSDVQNLFGWLLQHPVAGPLWRHVRSAQAVEARRLSRRAHNRFSGRLEHPAIKADVNRRLGRDYVWSATKFDELAACGFRFFAKRLLRLEAIEEPEAGLNALQLGTLNHHILERAYGELEDLSIAPENLDEALSVLRRVMDDELRHAPRRYGFRQSPLWEQEQAVIRRRLENLVKLDFSGSSPLDEVAAERYVGYQEVPFGMKGYPELMIDLGDDTDLIRVRGSIDRIDWVGDDGALIIDYKTGSKSPSVNEIKGGHKFQMLVYLLAAQEALANTNKRIVNGAFWQIRTLRISGYIKEEDGDVLQSDVVQEALGHLGRHVRAARHGDFAVSPSKPENRRCVRYCEFYQLCRMNMTHRHKDEV